MSIDDLRLRTKVLIPLALMAAGVLAVAACGTIRLIGVSSTASDIIERRDLAAVELNQAAQRMAALPHAVFGIILYSKEDPGRAAFAKEFENLTPETIALLDKAAQLLPDKTAEIGKFKERFSKLRRGRQGTVRGGRQDARFDARRWNSAARSHHDWSERVACDRKRRGYARVDYRHAGF